MRNKTMVKEKRKNRQIIVDTTLRATTKHGETQTSLVVEGELVCSGKENILMFSAIRLLNTPLATSNYFSYHTLWRFFNSLKM
jgi:hypothetical protein